MVRRAAMMLVAVGLLATACGSKKDDSTNAADDDDLTFAEDGTDSNAAENDAQLVTSSLVSSAAAGSVDIASTDLSGSDLGTRAFGDGTRALYLPHACLDIATVDASTLKYTFSRCIGPNGLRGVTGELVVKHTTGNNSLSLDLTATKLVVNGASMDWHATAQIVAEGANRTLTWSAQFSGTTARGKELSRTSTQTMSWTLGDECFALSGTSDGKVRDREIKTDIESFRRCRRGCPDAGGKITITKVLKNRTIEIDYDGSANATFTGPNGAKVAVPLSCVP